MPKIPFKSFVAKLKKPLLTGPGGTRIFSQSVFGQIHIMSKKPELNVNIQSEIKKLVHTYINDEGFEDAARINTGSCLQFADDLQEKVGGTVIGTNDNSDHYWLYWNGKHYDSETPKGVKHFENLPIWNYPNRDGRSSEFFEFDNDGYYAHRKKRINK